MVAVSACMDCFTFVFEEFFPFYLCPTDFCKLHEGMPIEVIKGAESRWYLRVGGIWNVKTDFFKQNFVGRGRWNPSHVRRWKYEAQTTVDEAPVILSHSPILLHAWPSLLLFVSATHHSHIVQSGMVSWSICLCKKQAHWKECRWRIQRWSWPGSRSPSRHLYKEKKKVYVFLYTYIYIWNGME